MRGVGRRILGFFILAGILPVIFTAGLAYYEIGRGLEQEVSRTLREHAKEYGLDVLSRLQHMSKAADQLAIVVNEQGIRGVAIDEHLLSDFETVWVIGASQEIEVVNGERQGVVKLADLSKLPASMPLPSLVTSIDATGGELVFLRRIISASGLSNVVALKPAASILWGLSEDLPFSTDVCVYTVAGNALHCSADIAAGLHTQLTTVSGRVNALPVEWRSSGQEQLASAWQLFLAGEFNAPALDIVASQPASFALRSRADFSRVFVPALILVIILVGLLSFNMIGRSLGPLQNLTMAARQVASGNLLSRVRIRSNDEFEWLGEAFNNMASQLGRQISTLEAMSGI
jgi:HAMP domain-containing protein